MRSYHVLPDGLIIIHVRGNNWLSFNMTKGGRWYANYYHKSRRGARRTRGSVRDVNTLDGYDELVAMLLSRDLVAEERQRVQDEATARREGAA